MKQQNEVVKIVLCKDNMAQYKGKSGRLLIKYNGKTLKEFLTDNVYPLYNTLKSLSKRKTGTYSNLPKNFEAVFEECDISNLCK
jgi:hypothetical protein